LQICRDGEGVTKLVEIVVTGARTEQEARQVADAIGTSCLVKTALYGEDANWGRIVAAVGRSGVAVQPSRLSVAIDGIPIVKDGAGLGSAAERRIARAVRQSTFPIAVDLAQGSARTSLWTTDLSHAYVTINASYRS
jgi:glutamate N-acetyltransferase/amino-acid N-acetyltransferase